MTANFQALHEMYSSFRKSKGRQVVLCLRCVSVSQGKSVFHLKVTDTLPSTYVMQALGFHSASFLNVEVAVSQKHTKKRLRLKFLFLCQSSQIGTSVNKGKR